MVLEVVFETIRNISCEEISETSKTSKTSVMGVCRRLFFDYSKNISIYLGASIIPILLSFIVNPFIAMSMSPKDYAISGYFQSFTTLISPFISFYFIGYYLKEYFKSDAEKRKYIYAVIAKGLIYLSGLFSVLSFSAIYAYIYFFMSDIEFPVMPYLAFVVFSIPLTGLMSLKLAQYRIERRSKSFFTLSTITSCISIGGLIVFVVLLKLGALGKLLAPFVCNLLIFMYLLQKERGVLKQKTDIRIYRALLAFCLPFVLGAMLEYFSNGFIKTYLERLRDIDEYGIFIVGSSIGAYVTTFSWAVMHTFQPDIYKSISNRAISQFLRVTAVEFSVIVCGVALFVIVAPYIIDFLTAGRYVAATPYARIISLSAITSVIYYHINDFCIITDHKYLYLATTFAGSIMIIGAVKCMTIRYGFWGGAWMTVLSYLILAFVNLVLLTFVRNNNLVRQQ